ncbi:MAG TPA: sulfurtransferase [Gemmatimonadales bacterium]|nr:sulfurtransferase [Gemmatimonadales bacterium]
MCIRLAGSLLALGLAAAPLAAAAPPAGAGPARGSLLVTPSQLSRQLNDPKLVILHIGPEKEYQAGHIAGARFFRLSAIEKADDSLALQLPDVAVLDSVFGSLGVGPDSRIVLYTGSQWVSITTRVWFTLDYMGLGGRTAILDGGLPAWRASNLPVTTDVPAPATPRRLTTRAHPEYVATADWINGRLADPRLAVIDARAPVFYKGVESGGFPRAGHIPGAKNLYFESVVGDDLRFRPDSTLRRLFAEAGYARGKDIVSYCHIGQQGTAVYFAARLLGLPVRLYDGSFQEWSARSDLAVEGTVPLTQGQLISTEELAGLLKQGNVSVIDARSDLAGYLANHIPGAPYLHFESFRASRGVPGDTLSPEVYAGLLGRLGVRRDRPVVIYGTGDAANFNATFLAWILSGFRHPKVYLLDGGYTKWAAEGRPLTRKYPEVEAGSYAADPFSLDLARVGWVQHIVNQPGNVLVDVRPADQFAGAAGAQVRRGHIPGAVNHFWQDDLQDAGGGAKVWKSIADLKASYERQGITPDKNVIVYCNTGTEASHVYFALHLLLGYPNVRVYVPSWTEWAAREDLPIEQGQTSASTGQ